MKLFGIPITLRTVTKLAIASAPGIAIIRQALKDVKANASK